MVDDDKQNLQNTNLDIIAPPGSTHAEYEQLKERYKTLNLCRHICSFNALCTKIFLEIIDKEKAKEIVLSFSESIAPTLVTSKDDNLKDDVDFRWFIAKILEKIRISNDFDYYLFYLNVLKSLKDSASRSTYSLLTSATKQTLSQKDLNNLMNFWKQNQPLFRAFRARVVGIIKDVDKAMIFKIFGNNSPIFTNEIDFNTHDILSLKHKDILQLIQSTFDVSSMKILENFQNSCVQSSSFPSTNVFGDLQLSLLNSSSNSRIHFVDVLLNFSLNSFNRNNFAEGTNALSIIPSLKDCATLLFIEREGTSSLFLSLLFSKVEISKEKSPVNDLLLRIRNDSELFKKIKLCTGQAAESSEVSVHSLPYLLESCLRNADSSPFETLGNKKHLCISDSDSVIDQNFVWAYFALHMALKAIEAQREADQLDTILQNLESCFDNITLNNVLNSIAEDIFSVLFIKDENGRFIYRASVVARIIQIIVPYADKQLQKKLSVALRKLQISQLVDNEDSLSVAMTDQKAALFSAINNKQWATAKVVVTKSPELAPILQEFTDIQRIRDSRELVDPSKESISLCINSSLSFRSMDDALKVAAESDSFASSIAKERLEKINEDPLSFCDFNSDFIDSVAEQIRKTDASEWKEIKADIPGAEQFKKYIKDINFKVKTLLGKEGFETVGKSISVSPVEFMKILIKSGDYEEVEKQAKAHGLNIVELVFSIRNSLDKNVLFSFLKEDKEALLMAKLEANMIPEDASDVIVKYMERTSKARKNININELQSKELEETLDDYDSINEDGCDEATLTKILDRALDNIQECADLIIDISYRISKEVFQKTVDEKLQKIEIDELGKVISYCNCEQEFVDSILLLATIKSRGIRTYPLKTAFAALVSSSENYELASKFVDVFRYKVDIKGVMREACLKQLRKSEPITELLNICPQLSKEILMSIPDRYKVTNTAAKPSKDVQNDVNEFTSENFDDKEKVLDFISKNPGINSDNLFFKQIEALSQSCETIIHTIRKMTKMIRVFCSIFKKPENVISAASKVLFHCINQISVSSLEEEQQATALIKQIYLSLNEFHEMLLPIVGSSTPFMSSLTEAISYVIVLQKFTSCCLFAKFNEKYDFNMYATKEKSDKLIELCFKYDYVDVALMFITAWKVVSSEERQRYVILCYSLGMLKSGVALQENYRRRSSKKSMEESQYFSEKIIGIFTRRFLYDNGFIQVLSKLRAPINIDKFMTEFEDPNQSKQNILRPRNAKSFIKKTSNNLSLASSRQGSRVSFLVPAKDTDEIPELVSEFEEGQPQFFLRVNAICSNSIESISKENHEKMLRYLLKNYASMNDHISYLASEGYFDKAFKHMKRAPSVQQKWSLFIGAIFPSAISFSLLPRMKQFVLEDDKDMKFYGSYLEKLLQVAMKNEMNNLRFEMQTFLNRNDEAAVTAVQLFLDSPTPYRGLRHLTVAQQALQTEIQHRSLHTKNTPEFLTTQQINKMSRDIVLQQLFIRFCIDEKISVGSEYNLFTNKGHALLMVVLLFKTYQYTLGIEIMRHSRVPPQEVASKIIDILVNEDEEKIIDFINGLSQHVDSETFETMVTTMLMRLSFVLYNPGLANAITTKCVKTPDYKCRLFIQFNQLESALSVAKSCRLTHMLPLIGNLAQKSNHIIVANEATRLLMQK